jgi:hypothetical protein
VHCEHLPIASQNSSFSRTEKLEHVCRAVLSAAFTAFSLIIDSSKAKVAINVSLAGKVFFLFIFIVYVEDIQIINSLRCSLTVLTFIRKEFGLYSNPTNFQWKEQYRYKAQ